MRVIQHEGSSLAAILMLKRELPEIQYSTFFSAYKASNEDLFTFTQEGEGNSILKGFGINFIWWA